MHGCNSTLIEPQLRSERRMHVRLSAADDSELPAVRLSGMDTSTFSDTRHFRYCGETVEPARTGPLMIGDHDFSERLKRAGTT